MPSLKGTQTEKNILIAFSRESQARSCYNFYANTARTESHMLISQIFLETANEDKEISKRLYKFLEGGDVEITATYKAGTIASTQINLEASAAEEKNWQEAYAEFAAKAIEEGLPTVAEVLKNIAVVHKQHEKQFNCLWKSLGEGTLYKREEAVEWKCRNCGFVVEAQEAPEVCPCCAHLQGYFEVLQDCF